MMQDDEYYSDEGDNRSDDESVDNDDDDDDDDTNGDDYNDAVTGMVGTRVDGLLLTKLLGLGTFGAVYEGETTAGACKTKYAVKCLFKAGLRPEHLDVQRQEVVVNQRLGQHPHVAHMVRVIDEAEYMLLVFEFCDRGDLFELIKREEAGTGIYDKTFAAELFLQLVDAVAHCHSKGVYHRDLKPENVLITNDWTVKLGDFGLATFNNQPAEFECGSPPYMGPEVFGTSGKPTYAAAPADVWALGVIFFNMLYGVNPWEKAISQDKHFRTFKDTPRRSLSERFVMSEDLLEVFVGMFAVNPSKRWDLGRVRSTVANLRLNQQLPSTGKKYSSSPAVHLQAGQYMRTPRPVNSTKALNKYPLPPEAYQGTAKTTTVGFNIDSHPTATPSSSIPINGRRPSVPATSASPLSKSALSSGLNAAAVPVSPSKTSPPRKSSSMSRSWADSIEDDDDDNSLNDLDLPVFNDDLPPVPTPSPAKGVISVHSINNSSSNSKLHGSPLRNSVSTVRHDSSYESFGDHHQTVIEEEEEDDDDDDDDECESQEDVKGSLPISISRPRTRSPNEQSVDLPDGSDGEDDDVNIFPMDMDSSGLVSKLGNVALVN